MNLDISLKTYAACIVVLRRRILDCAAVGNQADKLRAALAELELALYLELRANPTDKPITHGERPHA